MSHYHASKKDKKPRTTSKPVKCSVCGKPGVKAQMKRHPPQRGHLVHAGDCLAKARATP